MTGYVFSVRLCILAEYTYYINIFIIKNKSSYAPMDDGRLCLFKCIYIYVNLHDLVYSEKTDPYETQEKYYYFCFVLRAPLLVILNTNNTNFNLFSKYVYK